MPISFTCPHCGKQMAVADNFGGQTGPCAGCGKQITIPAVGFAPQRKSGAMTGIVIGLCVAAVMAVPCIVVLIALLLPAVQAAREAARRSSSSNNVKMIALALHNYHDTNGCLPPAVVKDENGNPLYSGRVLLLPYMEQSPIYDRFDKSKAWNSPENSALSQSALTFFNDPSAPGGPSARCDYAFVTGPGTAFEDGQRLTLMDFTDGTSNTIWLVESKQSASSWAEPVDLDIRQITSLPPSNHPSGNIVSYADGSVQMLPSDVPAGTVHALLTRNGGEIVQLP